MSEHIPSSEIAKNIEYGESESPIVYGESSQEVSRSSERVHLNNVGIPSDLKGKTVLELYSGGHACDMNEEIVRRGGKYISNSLEDRTQEDPVAYHQIPVEFLSPGLTDQSIDFITMRHPVIFGRILSREDEDAISKRLSETGRVLTEESPEMTKLEDAQSTASTIVSLLPKLRKTRGSFLALTGLSKADVIALSHPITQLLRKQYGNYWQSDFKINYYSTGDETQRIVAGKVDEQGNWLIKPEKVNTPSFTFQVKVP